MLLGFDALGRYGLLQFPSTSGAAALVAASGSYIATGRTATFDVSLAPAAGYFAPAGLPAALNTKQAADLAAIAATTLPAKFRNIVSAGFDNYSIDGSGMAFGLRYSVATGSNTTAGGLASFPTSAPAGAAACVVAASDVAFIRDFEAWFPRPYDLDDWSVQTREEDVWTAAFAASSEWSVQDKSASSWTPADKQSETWNAE